MNGHREILRSPLLANSGGLLSSGAETRMAQSLRDRSLFVRRQMWHSVKNSEGGDVDARTQANSLIRATALGYRKPKANRPMTRTTIRSERKPALRSV